MFVVVVVLLPGVGSVVCCSVRSRCVLLLCNAYCHVVAVVIVLATAHMFVVAADQCRSSWYACFDGTNSIVLFLVVLFG